jgi:hypothetical protein
MPATNILSVDCVNRLTPFRRWLPAVFWSAFFLIVLAPRAAAGGDGPQWLHALVAAQLPTYDEKTDAVLLYSETNVSVVSVDKIRIHTRRAYKVLRPDGRERGTLWVQFDPRRKITNLRGWCIPAQGKDYEVKENDAVDVAAPFDGGELVSDIKYKVLRIPAADPGNIVGYEYDVEEQPFWLQDTWQIQQTDPVHEGRFSLQLPPGWEYKASWFAYPEVKPTSEAGNASQWSVTDVKAIRPEPDMPPMSGVAGQMVVSFFPPGENSRKNEFGSWRSMGMWYQGLIESQMSPSDPIKQKVGALVSGKTTSLSKMQAIAAFLQHDIRYVAIQLGIGGWQPHAAQDVFINKYGDCKDKVTLMRTMLHEIGVDSYHVVINDERGAVTPDSPAHNAFNHLILAIKLPVELKDPGLVAVAQYPGIGRLLFFDPTDEMTPLGQIRGQLQANYGLLVSPEGGALIQVPQQPSATSSIHRNGKLTLDSIGTLNGEIEETRLGDRASTERWRLRDVMKSEDRIKPFESLLAGSLSGFKIMKTGITNLETTDQPFVLNYTFVSNSYAKTAGNLLLVRPRVLGNKGSTILESKDPRRFPVEFDGPLQDTDSFEIALPPGYEVDELPPPTNLDYSFASYHSKTEAAGRTIVYTRSIEFKELTVPVAKMDELKKFYRMIAADERNTAILKPAVAGN